MQRLAFLLITITMALIPLWDVGSSSFETVDDFPGWPKTWESLTLKPLDLKEDEKIFEESFPGRVARFTDGQREITFRWITEATRKLHPVADCMRAKGFRVEVLPGMKDQARVWGAMKVETGSQHLNVYECFFDQDFKESWSDVSQWFWSAYLGHSKGPWWAVTVVETAIETEDN